MRGARGQSEREGAPVIDPERIERAYVLAAYIVTRHGLAYAPYLDRLETELLAARRIADPGERARHVLETYTSAGGVRAIR